MSSVSTSSRRPALIVPELNLGNYPLLRLISLFRPVQIFSFDGKSKNLPLGSMRHVDMAKFIDADEVQLQRDLAYAEWEKVSEQVLPAIAPLRVQGCMVDLRPRYKQLVALRFERFWMFSALLKKMSDRDVVLLSKNFAPFLRENVGYASWSQRPSRFSGFNTTLEGLYEKMMQALRSLSALKALCGPFFSPRKEIPRVSILWDAVNSIEYSCSKDRLSFSWIINDESIKRDDVYFLFPTPLPLALAQECQQKGIRAGTIKQLYQGSDWTFITETIFKLLCVIFMLPFSSTDRSRFVVEWLKYAPVILTFRPKDYVSCISQIGHEMAQVSVARQLGARTVMYFYSANSYLWRKVEVGCKFRGVIFSNILAEYALVWHQSYADFLLDHRQVGCKVTVLGPVMAGDESVMEDNVENVRERWSVPPGKRILSLFDVSPIHRGHKIPDLYPVYYDVDYVSVFFRDMIRLLDKFPDLFIVYKPKRDLRHRRFTYSEEFHQSLDTLIKSKKGLLLDDLVNPWVPIAVSDICVGLPFTSPVVAGVHYGKVGIFHDPTGIVAEHRYDAIAGSISHSFEQLCEKIQASIGGIDRKKMISSGWEMLVGHHPMTNSSNRFRKILLENSSIGGAA